MSERYDCADPAERTAGLAAAAAALRDGGLVVLPTDTVYGLAADAFQPAAVTRLLAGKGRGRDMPVPVLVASRRMLDALAGPVPEPAAALIDAFWPGGLTLVLRHTPHLAWDLGDSRGTVAVRMPAHPLAVELIQATGPLAVSSANVTGQPPAVAVDDAVGQLGAAVAVYLDGGRCPAPQPSTIVDLAGPVPRLLRAGVLSVPAVRAVLPDLRTDP